MNRLRAAVLIGLSLFLSLPLSAGNDAGRQQMDSLLRQYIAAMSYESIPFKESECDFILSTCTDPQMRDTAATILYSNYFSSKIMGEEGVAVYLYDNWFATSRAHFPSPLDSLNAAVFAEFNRSSLLGCTAPRLEMQTPSGDTITVPRAGRRTILFFYDASCTKCNMTGILLRYLLEEESYDADLFAVYVGDDAETWRKYREEKLDIASLSVNVFHVWDPSLESDFMKKYGVLQTPGLFLVDVDGTVTGRRLDVEALKQLLMMYSAEDKLYSDLCPLGEKLPKMKIDGNNIRRYDYLVFYAEGCCRCEREMAAMEKVLPKGTRVLKVDVDDILSRNPSLAKEIFSKFDVSILPFILKEDKRGRTIEKYITFAIR